MVLDLVLYLYCSNITLKPSENESLSVNEGLLLVIKEAPGTTAFVLVTCFSIRQPKFIFRVFSVGGSKPVKTDLFSVVGESVFRGE